MSADYARPRQVAALERAALPLAGAEPLDQLTTRATGQLGRVNQLLAQLAPTTPPAVRLQKGYR
ncbi:hypothetical protein ACIPSA_50940 [Streptomyces sp. NPDC086549]|uniref:hypothetical protein n=1 Tax=Streptomyces sp. NPDC086549 TaxID=3365752 RepID=UPI00381ABC5F